MTGRPASPAFGPALTAIRTMIIERSRRRRRPRRHGACLGLMAACASCRAGSEAPASEKRLAVRWVTAAILDHDACSRGMCEHDVLSAQAVCTVPALCRDECRRQEMAHHVRHVKYFGITDNEHSRNPAAWLVRELVDLLRLPDAAGSSTRPAAAEFLCLVAERYGHGHRIDLSPSP